MSRQAGGDKKGTFPGEAIIQIMAVYYKMYQENRKKSPNYGKWYGRAAMVETDTTDELAKSIMEKCTVNEADVLAVIKALVGEITKSLQASHRVKLAGFGTFKLGLKSAPADSRKDFVAEKNIKSVHVLFQPELKITRAGRSKTFLQGVKVKELPKYTGVAAGGAESGSDGGSTAGGNEKS